MSSAASTESKLSADFYPFQPPLIPGGGAIKRYKLVLLGLI